jgi:hypothetical protein
MQNYFRFPNDHISTAVRFFTFLCKLLTKKIIGKDFFVRKICVDFCIWRVFFSLMINGSYFQKAESVLRILVKPVKKSKALVVLEKKKKSQRVPYCNSVSKGQISSNANFLVLIWTKNPTKIFFYFCPSLQWGWIKKIKALYITN